MRRFGIVGLVLVAVVVLSGLAASAAFALPEHLPKGAWTGKDDGGATNLPKLETLAGNTLECGAAKGSGKDTSDTLGEFTITFEACKNPKTGFKCNSLGDGAGVILTSGEYHYVYDTLTPTLGIAILFLPKEVHLECTALVLILIKSQASTGGLICLILEPTSSKITHLFHCEQSAGDQLETKYWNDAGVEQANVHLLCSTNGGAFETCAELALAETTFPEANLWENA